MSGVFQRGLSCRPCQGKHAKESGVITVSNSFKIRALSILSSPALWSYSCVTLFALVCALIAAHSSGGGDAYRDLYFVQQIAQGDSFPVQGPLIGGILHLSALWYYVLVPFYWLGGAFGALFGMGLFVGLKFPLALFVARRAGFGWNASLVAAFAVGLPGWSTLALIAPTHAGASEAMVLACIAMALSVRDAPHQLRRWALLGMLFVLSVHAHPVAFVLAVLMVSAVVRFRVPVAELLRGLSALCLVFALGMAPVWLGILSAEKPEGVQGLGFWSSSVLSLERIADISLLLRSVFWGGGEFTMGYWLAEGSAYAWIMGAYSFVLILSAFGLLASLAVGLHRSLSLLFLILIFVHSASVVVMRDITPYWMLYAHGVLVAFFVALGSLYWIEKRWLTYLPVFWCGAVAAATLFAALGFVMNPPSTLAFPTFQSPGPGFMDVTQVPIGRTQITHQQVNVSQIEDAGRLVCGGHRLYGHLAVLTDLSFGIGPRRFCSDPSRVEIGGSPSVDEEAIVGLNLAAATALGWQDQYDEHLGLVVARARRTGISSSSFKLIEGGRFPWRDFSAAESHEANVPVELAKNEALLLTDRSVGSVRVEIGVTFERLATIAPIYTDRFVRIWQCPQNRSTCVLNVSFVGDPDSVDLVVTSSELAISER